MGGVIALGKKKIVLILGVNVGNAPAVYQDFHRICESRNLQSRRGFLREQWRCRDSQTQRDCREKNAERRPHVSSHNLIHTSRMENFHHKSLSAIAETFAETTGKAR